MPLPFPADKERPDFRSLLQSLSSRHDLRKVFDAFIRLASCALAMETRELEYLEEAKNWTKDELQVFAEALAALVMEMERHPFEDRLGAYYMKFALSSRSQERNWRVSYDKASLRPDGRNHPRR